MTTGQLPVLIIPAYQPEPRLVPIVDALLQRPYPVILVVDDGSDEDKKPIFKELAKKERVTVLTHAVNLGKGAALKTAFNHALVHFGDRHGVVTVDADGQHLPDDVYKVAGELIRSPESLVLGARTFSGKIPLRSQFGNILTRYIFHFLIGKKISDTQTGLRGISRMLMRQLLTVSSSRYEFELDMLVAAANQRLNVIEVPITTVYEEGNPTSHFNPLLDSARIYFVFLRFIFTSLLTACADLVVFSLTFYLTGALFGSVVTGRAVGAAASFIASKKFVFKSDRNALLAAGKFLLLWLALLGVSYLLTSLAVDYLRVNVYLARVCVDSLLFVFNFLVQRDLIFTKANEPATR